MTLFLLTLLAFIQGAVVELHVFCGDNPNWEISEGDYFAVSSMVETKNRFLSKNYLGYQGFSIRSKGDFFVIVNNAKAEYFLLNSRPSHILPGNNNVVVHVKERIEEDFVGYRTEPLPFPEYSETEGNLIIRGPDNVTDYDPHKWNDDSHILHHNDNYNYGMDIRTDSDAFPGKASGKEAEAKNCYYIAEAAFRDGMSRYDGPEPIGDIQPEKGHFTTMWIWAGGFQSYVFGRKDADNTWSWKCGSNPVTNLDKDSKPIPNPRLANMAPYLHWCTYYIAIPSNMTIE